MMYQEFLELSGVNYNEVTGDIYANEIEPAYMAMPPEIVKDKKEFVKWWAKNRELCKFISKQNKTVYELGKQVSSASKNAQALQAQLTDTQAVNKKYLETNEHLAGQVTKLKLRAAFAPEKLVNEMRLYYFEEYENAKATAKELGII